ncbi:MmcQ/YjbR family DNA-binding protein [Ruminococcus sp. Marseille-P6503]|uniref:MmcQ/YjbR family DNA-binding protein n=1 Tax=Ruminococcus sp. Marseille-P6503 TaxID=2364796 RepID=UPI000F53D985|nr:MmcQ/YjbR family DNA-binding protein [Ruminococcus sp. Marseille-P6503]
MTKAELTEYCGSLAGAATDMPFEGDFETVVARHQKSRKWFAVIMKPGKEYFVNLKCEPMEADMLRRAYKGVVPAYHMNKTHWNSVYLESDVSEAELKNMVYRSYLLTGGGIKTKAKGCPGGTVSAGAVCAAASESAAEERNDCYGRVGLML